MIVKIMMLIVIMIMFLTIVNGFVSNIIKTSSYRNQIKTSSLSSSSSSSSSSIIMMEDLDDKINSAIESCGFKVTSADVASKAGVDLDVASSSLIRRAYETGASMDVTRAGDIIYTFPLDYKNKMFSSSMKYKLQAAKKVVVPIISQVFVVSFSVVFLSTTMLVFSTLLLASQSSSTDDKNKRYHQSSATVEIPVRVIIDSVQDYLYYKSRYDNNDYMDENFQIRTRKLSFLESFYSFFFGDGDSNKHLNQIQFELIANAIRNNNGSVIAEQLNPFLDPPELKNYLSARDNAGIDENHILPALVAFKGVPIVTENGDLVYQFKELMNTAANETSMNRLPSNKHGLLKLNENEQIFSLCTPQQLAAATTLGIFNFIGCLVIGKKIKENVAVAQYLSIARNVYPLLQWYSFLYLAIPLVRFLVTSSRNRHRKRRNDVREEWMLWINTKEGKDVLHKKLTSREALVPENDDNDNEIVYSTKDKPI